MLGYQRDFLGIDLPLPVVMPERQAAIVRNENLTEECLAVYPTYAVLTDRVRRSPVYSVLMIDQGAMHKTGRSDSWRLDSRVGAEFQLDNAYYANNPWDRGHMARRESAAWGKSRREAQKASDETFYFSNACLQHANVNQDEWLALEDWVKDLDIARGGKIVVFAGPVYGEFPRTLTPTGRASAEVPAGFFKVVCFVHAETGLLDVRAFLVLQDQESMRDKDGRKTFNFQHYQVTITEIERLTGLDFPDEVYERNPLYFHPHPDAEALGARSFPERVDVNGPDDLVGHGDARVPVADDDVEVYIAAAMVDPPGADRQDEWVSIMNLEAVDVDLAGWKLIDKGKRVLVLDGVVRPGEARTFRGPALAPLRLGANGGLLTLVHANGLRIDRVDYTARDVRRILQDKGRPLPIIFATYRAEH